MLLVFQRLIKILRPLMCPVLASSCLGTSPRWMETHRDTLQNLTLKRMFLPGTHNSAAFLVSDRPFRETFVQKYVFNQVNLKQ